MGSSQSAVQEPAAMPTKGKPCEGDSCSLTTNKNAAEEQQQKPKLKPCCACPETKKARDMCIVERGEENCKDLIEAHKECMRKMGFKI